MSDDLEPINVRGFTADGQIIPFRCESICRKFYHEQDCEEARYYYKKQWMCTSCYQVEWAADLKIQPPLAQKKENVNTLTDMPL